MSEYALTGTVRRVPWRDVLGAFGISRIVIALLGIVGVATFVDQHSLLVGNATALNPEVVWQKWDAVWYERIALHGYGWRVDDIRGQAVAGFFPLYPALVGYLLRLVPAFSFFWLGSFLSNVFTLATLALIAHSLTEGAEDTRRALIVMMTAAGSFYLSIPYTESLFCLLVAGTMVATRRRRYLIAAILCGLAALTRVQGFALVVMPVVASLRDKRFELSGRIGRAALMITTTATPVVLYMAYLLQVQGQADAFVARQALWGNADPYLLKAFVGLAVFDHRLSGWIHGGFWCLYAALLVRYWKQIPLGEALFCAGALLISTEQESFHGIYRYTVPLIPIALAIARDREPVRETVIGVNLIIGTLMILAYVTNNRLTV